MIKSNGAGTPAFDTELVRIGIVGLRVSLDLNDDSAVGKKHTEV